MTFYRADTLLTKEPDTIRWIDSMQPEETLWDIGANIGVYTLYALQKGLRVVAFEPFAGNYQTLLENVRLNGFKCDAFQVAISDGVGLDFLLLSGFEKGSSRHNIGQPQHDRYRFETVGSQGIATTTMDAAMMTLGAPNHIKIDVDGLEQKIIAGGAQTLKAVKSVLIEVDQEDKAELSFISERMKEAGLACSDGPHRSAYRAANMIFRRQ
jgi:FkbM family methyltransferase